jgi:hypothetical protein
MAFNAHFNIMTSINNALPLCNCTQSSSSLMHTKLESENLEERDNSEDLGLGITSERPAALLI